MHMTELTSYADYFVVASSPSERQTQAIARQVADELKKKMGKRPMNIDGMQQGNWVIVDYGAVVVHIFQDHARQYYDLDGFWRDAPRLDVDEARGLACLKHHAALLPTDDDGLEESAFADRTEADDETDDADG
jgi:ribosome-associated protein